MWGTIILTYVSGCDLFKNFIIVLWLVNLLWHFVFLPLWWFLALHAYWTSHLNLVVLLLLYLGVYGYMEFIPQARVPVLQYVSNRFGISCDLSVDNYPGRIKSKIFYWISTLDERFGDMVLLVSSKVIVFCWWVFLVNPRLSIKFPCRSRSGQKLITLMIQKVGPWTPIRFAYLFSSIFR